MTGPRLSIIPARACTDPQLKPRDLQVLCVLGRHTDDLGWCRKSQVKMADEMGCGRSTVFDAIERLIKAGYLERHVHEEENGRDSPHSYRVVLDPKEADSCGEQPTPPAGIPAPPAGPGPAPKNDSSRTLERDARADEREDPKKVEAEGWALLKNWPGFDGMPKDPAMAIWRTMSAADRATARARFLQWLELLRKQRKSHIPAPSTYLRERLFEAVPDPQAAPPPPLVAPPFGKLWGALRTALLLNGPGALPRPSSYVAGLIDQGGEIGERERLRHQAQHGWPQVRRMDEMAESRRGWTLASSEAWLEAPASGLEPIRVGSPEWDAWQAAYQRRGWPWLPDPGRQEWVYFPAGGPDGLEAFERAVREAKRGNEDHDTDRPEASE